MKLRYFSFLLIILSLAVGIDCCQAQSIRYMDESGNLHFVDSIYQVPPKYRNQVLAPTPAPTGRVQPTRRPTPTRKPTRTPKPKKSIIKQNRPGSSAQDSVFSNFPNAKQDDSQSGNQGSTANQGGASEAPLPKQGGLRPPPLPLLSGPPQGGQQALPQGLPPGVPSGVLAPGVAPAPSSAPVAVQ